MKYALVIIVVAILVGGAAYTYVKNGEQKNQELELVARKAEAAQKKAEAEKKKAEEAGGSRSSATTAETAAPHADAQERVPPCSCRMRSQKRPNSRRRTSEDGLA